MCGYSTFKASHLMSHKLINTREKPYLCGSCEYSCSRASHLKTHSYTHTEEKPYQCRETLHCIPRYRESPLPKQIVVFAIHFSHFLFQRAEKQSSCTPTLSGHGDSFWSDSDFTLKKFYCQIVKFSIVEFRPKTVWCLRFIIHFKQYTMMVKVPSDGTISAVILAPFEAFNL